MNILHKKFFKTLSYKVGNQTTKVIGFKGPRVEIQGGGKFQNRRGPLFEFYCIFM